jgi:DNA-binding beta-propeller fold protein YncE
MKLTNKTTCLQHRETIATIMFIKLTSIPVIFIILVQLISGCAVNIEKDSTQDKLLVWPAAPASPKYQYIMTIRDSMDVVEIPDAQLRSLLTGSNGKKGIELKEAYGIAAKQGLIVVTDRRRNLVHAFNIPKRKYYAFGYRREGKLSNPLGIALDDKLNVYVADSNHNRIIVYDQLGLFIRFIGEDESFLKLTDVSVNKDGTSIVAVDTGGVDSAKHRFVVFDQQGNKRFEVGKRGNKESEFNLPVASAIGLDGTIYILDAGNFRVQAFNPQGHYLFSFGKLGDGFGQFSRAKGITTDKDGNIYVSDANFGNVQVFDPQGRFLLPIGKQTTDNRPGGYRLPIGIATDNNNYLYIVDAFFNKLDVIKKINAK